MASSATTSPPPPSAAARVFAIPELFEKIFLNLIISEIFSPAFRPSLVARYTNNFLQPGYIEDQFRFLRINRHTYATITNSKPIQSLCFAPTSKEPRCPVFGCPPRVIWLSLACEKFVLGRTMLGNPVLVLGVRAKGTFEVGLDDSPCVSWRKYSVMLKRGPDLTFKVMQCLFPDSNKLGSVCKVVPVLDRNARDMYFRIERGWTLGELYDKIVEIQPGSAKRWLGDDDCHISMVYT
ncbi:hypothetical protein AC578_1613 [Pseudocercospora eumusae]|uniref:Uncharacterized protein n=1 Tax=Pseudocercospora eumusae TaxID=321146 RepID=A0A139HMC1_9PEZI|nr:hypothetical protein AC578_1613 [Pseudocercospora eumusae]